VAIRHIQPPKYFKRYLDIHYYNKPEFNFLKAFVALTLFTDKLKQIRDLRKEITECNGHGSIQNEECLENSIENEK